MDDIMTRLGRLERDARRWRRAALGLGGLLAGCVLAAAAAPAREVRAGRFVFVDERGRECGDLGAKTGGVLGLTLRDPETGSIRGVLGMVGPDPVLSLISKEGAMRVRIATGPDGVAGLNVLAPDGTGRLTAAVAADGVPYVALDDSERVTRAMLEADGGTGGILSFRDRKGDPEVMYPPMEKVAAKVEQRIRAEKDTRFAADEAKRNAPPAAKPAPARPRR